jgi:uncharacterized lipoprotein YbaY
MPLRPFTVLSLALLLSACANTQSSLRPPVTPPSATAATAVAPRLPEITGTLLGVPAEAEVELALLTVNERGLPQGQLSTVQLHGTGAPLPFRLRFDPASPRSGYGVQLRGRVQQSGQLLWQLPKRPIQPLQAQNIGLIAVPPRQ